MKKLIFISIILLYSGFVQSQNRNPFNRTRLKRWLKGLGRVCENHHILDVPPAKIIRFWLKQLN